MKKILSLVFLLISNLTNGHSLHPFFRDLFASVVLVPKNWFKRSPFVLLLISRKTRLKIFLFWPWRLPKPPKASVTSSFRVNRAADGPLIFGCCELSHVIFLMLRTKELLAKISKFTKWQLFSLNVVLHRLSFWVKMIVILWIC